MRRISWLALLSIVVVVALAPSPATADTYTVIDSNGTQCTTYVGGNLDRSHFFATSNTGCNRTLYSLNMTLKMRRGVTYIGGDQDDCLWTSGTCGLNMVVADDVVGPQPSGLYQAEVDVVYYSWADPSKPPKDPWLVYEPGLCVANVLPGAINVLDCHYIKPFLL